MKETIQGEITDISEFGATVKHDWDQLENLSMSYKTLKILDKLLPFNMKESSLIALDHPEGQIGEEVTITVETA